MFEVGAAFIGILIMKNLHVKIGLPLKIESDELKFINYINAADARYVETRLSANRRKLP